MWQCARCTWTLLRLAQCAGHTTWTLSWPAQCAGHTQTPFATCPMCRTYFANLNKREDLLFTTQHDGPHKHVILLLSPNTIWGSWKHTQISWNWATTVIYLQTLAWLHESDGTKWVRISFDAVSHRLTEIFWRALYFISATSYYTNWKEKKAYFNEFWMGYDKNSCCEIIL